MTCSDKFVFHSVTIDLKTRQTLDSVTLVVKDALREVKERSGRARASELCEIAVQLKPKEIQFHLNLGEVYASAGLREKALDKLDHALELFGEDARLRQARSKVEKRRAPLLPFFGRKHFLNRKLGKLRHRILTSLDK